MALITTVAGSDTDSYISVRDTDLYFNGHWSLTKQDSWNAMETAQKERLLKTATHVLETMRFLDREAGGTALPESLILNADDDIEIRRYSVTQRLSFPRNVDVDADGVPFVPQAIKDATCEQAVYIITFDEAVLATQYTGIIAETAEAGSVRMYANYGRLGTMLSPIAAELIRPYLRPTRRLMRA
jgi:hypothetical protein